MCVVRTLQAISCVFLFVSSIYGQPLEKELFKLDLLYVQKHGDSPAARARYWYYRALAITRKSNEYPELESIVARVDLLKRAVVDAPDKEAYQIALEQYKKAISDPSISEEVVNAVGVDRLTEIIVAGLKESLLVEIASNSNSVLYSEVLLASPSLQKYLGLSPEQQEEITTIIQTSGEQLRIGAKDEFDKLKFHSDDRWQKIQQVLTHAQRIEANRLVGQPIEWFRCIGENALKNKDYLSSGPTSSGLKAEEFERKLHLAGREISDATSKEFEEHEVFLYPCVTHAMIFDKFFWDELEFSIEQRQELQVRKGKAWKVINESHVTYSGYDRLYLQQILNEQAKPPVPVSDFLTSDQCKWMLQMEFQVLTKHFDSVGILNPIVKQHLDLSPNQVSRIEVISTRFDELSKPLLAKIDEARKEIRKEIGLEVKGVLSTTQTRRLDELFAKRKN